jgi:hypothetical protein
MPTVFLSYRRSDTGGEAGRLADTFQRKLGKGLTFRDVSSIPIGEEFQSFLERELAAAKVVLVLIGPEWLTELGRRLGQSEVDYVRLEISAALARRKRIIPILLQGATLPAAGDLPEEIGSLSKHQAMTLRDESWSQDVDRLIDSIGRPYPWRKVALRALVTLFLILLAVKLLLPLFPNDLANDLGFLRTLVILLIGIYVLFELGLAYRYFGRSARKMG